MRINGDNGDGINQDVFVSSHGLKVNATQLGTWVTSSSVSNFPSSYPVTQSGAWSVSPGTGVYLSAQSGNWSVSPGTGTYPSSQNGRWSIDIGSVTANDNGRGKPHLHTEIYDNDENKEAIVTPMRELKVASAFRLVGATYINGWFDPNFWSSTTVNNGFVTVSSGSLFMYASSGTQTNGQSTVTSLRIARFISGSSNEYRAVVRVDTTAVVSGNNDMRWGISDDPLRNGFFFYYSSGTFGVGYRTAGIETLISTNNFNGYVPTITSSYFRYQIIYNNLGATFYVNDELAHRLSPTITPATETVNFKIRFRNINSSGANAQNVLECRVASIMRIGPAESVPVKRRISGAATTVYKYGPGTMHHITVNDSGAASSSITLYDSTFTSTANIFAIINTAKSSVGNINYDVPFDNGLTVVTSGTIGDITLVYE